MQNLCSEKQGAVNEAFYSKLKFKGTVMQIEKALINDRSRVSKVS